MANIGSTLSASRCLRKAGIHPQPTTWSGAIRRHGLACRIVSYQATTPGSNPQRRATLTWCKRRAAGKLV